jgi:hypothetical protein
MVSVTMWVELHDCIKGHSRPRYAVRVVAVARRCRLITLLVQCPDVTVARLVMSAMTDACGRAVNPTTPTGAERGRDDERDSPDTFSRFVAPV